MRAPNLQFARLLAAVACAVALALPAAGETPPAVGLTLDGMTYLLSHRGAVDLLVEAKRAEVSPRTGRIELVGVRARLGAAAGAPEALGGLEFVCARGSLDLEAREFVATGAIDGRLHDGSALQTERLHYHHDRGLVSSDAPVSLRDGAGDFTGGGFQFWVRENRFRLTRGARIVQGER